MTPYLSVASAEKRSGKTLLLEVLELLVARPWFTGRVTVAVLVRKVDAELPSLLPDESDAAFRGDKEYAETLRAVLNTGYRRGGRVSVCVGQGANITYRDFSAFGPKAIAGIRSLPDTVADRSIQIMMKRKASGEKVERFRQRDAETAAVPLGERAASWSETHLEALRSARPEVSPILDDRAAEVWEPLLAIADLAGGEWPSRAWQAALVLSSGTGREDDSLGVRLLRDIRAVFDEGNLDRIASGELAAALNAMEEAPWGDLRGKSLDPRTLARLLKTYGIGPKQVRFGEDTRKGYERAWFLDAWARYIPPGRETSETSETNSPGELSLIGADVSDVSDVSANAGHAGPIVRACQHRPPGEADELWGLEAWGEHPCMCRCCCGPARSDPFGDAICPTCRIGEAAPPKGGHLVRMALDLGATLAEQAASVGQVVTVEEVR